MEHRASPRKRFDFPVAFRVGDGPRLEATCSDLSLGGMFLGTPQPAPYGTEVHVLVTLPDLKQEADLRAVVRWATADGMGVQFAQTGARETHGLTELLAGR